MDKAILCSPDEMNRLQYIEESKMTFEERLRLAFSMLELSKVLSPSGALDYQDDPAIEWITLHLVND
jgi:hypothetical protein